MHGMTTGQWFEYCRDISEAPGLARDVLLSAGAGCTNMPMSLTLSDQWVLTFARLLQAEAYEMHNIGLALTPAAEQAYLVSECLRTILVDARVYNRRPHACETPPDDYEAGKPRAPAGIDHGRLADLRAQLAQALQHYRVVDSMVESPGKFDNEHVAAIVYHELTMDGSCHGAMWHHDNMGTWHHIVADATDCAMWPDLGMRPGDAIEIREDELGFVAIRTIREADRPACEAELRALCYPEEDGEA